MLFTKENIFFTCYVFVYYSNKSVLSTITKKRILTLPMWRGVSISFRFIKKEQKLLMYEIVEFSFINPVQILNYFNLIFKLITVFIIYG